MKGRLARCIVCTTAPVAMRGVQFCFTCWPGGPVVPPPCLRCGSDRLYYSGGLCAYCHPRGTPPVDACPDCLAWGTTRNLAWLCKGCKNWRRSYPNDGPCRTCGRPLAVSDQGSCRLCHKQASHVREAGARLDLVGANRHGQQLFLADLFQDRTTTPHRAPAHGPPVDGSARARSTLTVAAHEQLALLRIRHDLAAAGRTGLHRHADPDHATSLEALTRDLASARGWSKRQVQDTILGVRIILGLQPHGQAPVRASEVDCLKDIDLPVWTAMEVFTTAGLLIEDRTATIDAWFTQHTHGLPDQMLHELTTWFEVMKHGSHTSPRRRPRSQLTIHLHLRWALPTLRAWAATGHTSLREITKDHVLDALPASGNPRSTTGQGLKSIFRLLKARKILFTDPTARISTGEHERRQPLPLDLLAVRTALTSPDPARACVVALIAFHGLRPGHLQRLRLTDIRDGRLTVDGRVIPLADPVRERLATYLTHRNNRWPRTTNPHLFVHYRTAGKDTPVGHRWLRLTVGEGLTPSALREDRILSEVHANGGDVRALADLFGLSINASARYTATLEHPDFATTWPTPHE